MALGCSRLLPSRSSSICASGEHQLLNNSVSGLSMPPPPSTSHSSREAAAVASSSHYSLLCPPRPSSSSASSSAHRHHPLNNSAVSESVGPWWKSLTKKYVILCCICGGSAVLLGVIFISIYFTLHYYTSSLQYFETIPTYAPAVVLIITGLLVMCFSRRRNRYAYLIKLAGGCCLVCAVLCVVITVTTTVIHMNRLQTLRECVYTQKSKICTCFAGIGDEEGSAKYIFNNTPDCEVVHGSLYTCLRAMFGLSVIGILVCIFSSMLVYQLLSHEKKKMYWEQLEMRRRFYYRQPSSHPLYCNCYDDYGFAATAAPPPPPPHHHHHHHHHELYHWQPWDISSDRCWPIRGISPRPAFTTDDGGGRSVLVGSSGHRASGWNWLPWSRNRNSACQSTPLNNATVNSNSNSCAPNEQLSTISESNDVDRVQNNLNEDASPRLPSFSAVHPYWSAETRFGAGTNSSRRNGRRRRSNDAVFHHLSMTPPSRYQSPFCLSDSNYVPPPISFSAYNSLSRHMWGPPPPYSQQSSVENVVVEHNAPPHLRHFFRAATIANPGPGRTNTTIARDNNAGGGGTTTTPSGMGETNTRTPTNYQQTAGAVSNNINENQRNNQSLSPVKIYSNELMVDVAQDPINLDDPIYDTSLRKSSYFAGKGLTSQGTSTLPNLLQQRKEEESVCVLSSKSASYLSAPMKTTTNMWPVNNNINISTAVTKNVFGSCSSCSGSRSSSSSYEVESDFRSSALVSSNSSSCSPRSSNVSSSSSTKANAFPTDILCVRSLPNLNLASVLVSNVFQPPPPLPLPPPPPPAAKAVKNESLSAPVTLHNSAECYVKRSYCAEHDYSAVADDKCKSVGNLPLPVSATFAAPAECSSRSDSIIVTFKSVHV